MMNETDLKFYAECIRKGDDPESVLRFALASQETALRKASNAVQTVETNLRGAEDNLHSAVEQVEEAKRLISEIEKTPVAAPTIVDAEVSRDQLAAIIYEAWLANRADGEGLTTFDGTPNSLSYAIADQVSGLITSSASPVASNNERVE
jgi:hypothetical protein